MVTHPSTSTTRLGIASRFALLEKLSLRLSRYAEGFWAMPIEPHTPVNRDFGPWQGIEFSTDGMEESPLPPGPYEVRYRVAKYM